MCVYTGNYAATRCPNAELQIQHEQRCTEITELAPKPHNEGVLVLVFPVPRMVLKRPNTTESESIHRGSDAGCDQVANCICICYVLIMI